MNAGNDQTVEHQVRRESLCCICAQASAQGVRDKGGRFVCGDCLERARQSILDRKAREARAKLDARARAEVERAESDNSEVLGWRSALDPATALLCPNCGRILQLDVGTCHACGYGAEDQRPTKRFSWLARRTTSTRSLSPSVLELNASWLNAIDPRLELVQPIALAVLLWTMTALAFRHPAALVTANLLVITTLAGLTGWFLVAVARRSVVAAALHAAPPLGACVFALVDPLQTGTTTRWTLVGVFLGISTVAMVTRTRGTLLALWFVALVPAAALIVLATTR